MMTAAIFSCEGIFNLTSFQKNLLTQKLNASDIKIMPHEISNLLAISKVDAIAILSALQANDLSKNYIVLYHNCEPDYPVEYIPFENGFPSIPWTCENCQNDVFDIGEISFGLIAITKTSIQFI